jgi:hypothetical protein
MAFLERLFKGSGVSDDEDASATGTTMICDCCGSEVDENEVENGQCEECNNSEYSGTKYCCGAIYEEGEDTCASCGEPL